MLTITTHNCGKQTKKHYPAEEIRERNIHFWMAIIGFHIKDTVVKPDHKKIWLPNMNKRRCIDARCTAQPNGLIC